MLGVVPARGGSKRLPDKNLRLLDSRSLVEIAVTTAWDSGCFSQVVCSTDSDEIACEAGQAGARIHPRPEHLATDDSTDLDWLRHLLATYECRDLAILRPTSPFRTVETIQRAVILWRERKHAADSLRAVRRVSEHPAKMWVRTQGGWLVPAGKFSVAEHNLPTQQLGPYYVQSGCLEITHRATIDGGSQSGGRILAFETPLPEGLDVNDEWDLLLARAFVKQGVAV